MPNERHQERLSMGAGAVLSLGEAAGLLPVADREAREWLRENGLVSYIKGRPVVAWSAVIEALRNPEVPAPGASKPKPRTGSLPRVRL